MLALKCGFEVDFISDEVEQYKFESVDKMIEWSLVTMNIDPSSIDHFVIENFRKEVTEPHFQWKKIELVLKRTC